MEETGINGVEEEGDSATDAVGGLTCTESKLNPFPIRFIKKCQFYMSTK